MRCPKCSYISFDQVENCLKCGKPLPAVEGLIGTVYDVALPAYLHSSLDSDDDFMDDDEMDVDEGEDSPLSFDKEEEEREIEVEGFAPASSGQINMEKNADIGGMEIEEADDDGTIAFTPAIEGEGDDATIAFTPDEPKETVPAAGGASDGGDYGDFNFELDLDGIDLGDD